MFKNFTAEQYRALSNEDFEARVAEYTDAVENNAEADADALLAEADIIAKERKLRNLNQEIRSAKATKVANGLGVAIENSRSNKHASALDVDVFASEEYERAFMEYTCRRTPIPAEYRDALDSVQFRTNQFTTTGDAGAVIPTKLMNTIIEKLDTYGDIWKRVHKVDVKGGVEYPVGDFKPVAHWVTETAPSSDQKLTLNDTISFTYHMIEVKIARSFLASIVTLEVFQKRFPELAVEAIIKALEQSIIRGTGSGQMQGIVTDDRIPEGHKIELTETELGQWDAWHKKVKAKMAKAYRKGIFIMSQATFDSYIDGMVDQNGQPVGRVNYGINGEENMRFLGKEVLTVEPEVLPDYDASHTSEVFAMFVDLSQYTVNTNMNMRVANWTDEDNNLNKVKAQMVVDGKLIDPNGVLLLTTPAGA